MSYDPYGQPYDPYRQQGGYQHYDAYQYPGYDNSKAPIKGPSFGKVIGVILVVIVLIAVIAVGVMVYYINQTFPSDPEFQDNPPSATFVTSKHDNPQDDLTVNGGYWSARIAALSGNKPSLSDVKLIITYERVTYTTWSSVASATIDCTDCKPHWYLMAHDRTPVFADGSDVTALASSTAPQVGPNEFGTIQGAYMVYLDNDDDGKMSVDDVVLVFKDPDGDGNDEILSGYSIEISTSKGAVATVSLY